MKQLELFIASISAGCIIVGSFILSESLGLNESLGFIVLGLWGLTIAQKIQEVK